MSRDEGPSEADIAASERPSSGSGRKWLARAGLIFLLLAILSLILSAIAPFLQPDAANPAGKADVPDRASAVVTGVIDGITIAVEIGGKAYEVRYLGVDLPPVGDAWRGLATTVNANWVEGHIVLLERDTRDADEGGRLLRYVWVDDLFVNGALIAVGLGTHSDQYPDPRHSPELAMFERNARTEKVGMWQTRGVRAVPGGEAGDGAAGGAATGRL
jgi:endonuclease YncB( thermonuclease family)